LSGAVAAYAAALVAFGVLDALWLGVLARRFYRREFGALMRPQPRWVPAALFYFGYPLGLVGLALQPMPESIATAVARCAALGAVAYGTYDLTNLATLNGFSRRMATVDIAWGIAVSAAAGAAGWWAAMHWVR